ncbi:hypothetical protein P9112_008868 [Eukaryota sp. TZLM1-RC]
MDLLEPELRQEFTSIIEKAQSLKPLDWSRVYPLTEKDNQVVDASSISAPRREEIEGLLKRVVVMKLNGGLGTSMGCAGPKSLIEVQDGKTFLDLVLEQIEHLNKEFQSEVPLLLMNSFNTDQDTKQALANSPAAVRVLNCVQSQFPRLDASTWEPIATTRDKPEEWYPPGHGDVFRTLKRSGLLDSLMLEGRDIIFVSNIDNLGATLDLSILKYMTHDHDFISEQTIKTAADVKGGAVITYENRVSLLESAQVPKDHMNDFTSISKFPYFNTNNIWFKIPAAKQLLDSKELDLDVIVNPKKLGDRPVLQLEQAVGSAISSFKHAGAVIVPRDRFLPVKKTNDLFLVKSNLFVNEHGRLVKNPAAKWWSFNSIAPPVRLGHSFTTVEAFNKRVPQVPDLSNLCHLTVSGDVTFDAGVKLSGTVIIVVDHGKELEVDNDLQDVIVTSREQRVIS